MREIEHLLARAGVPSARRRELVLEMKGGMRDAASTGMRDAAVVAEVEGLLHSIRSI
jgi:hypothetical protein